MKSGNLWRDTNNVLVELLNGLEIRNSYTGQYGGGVGSEPVTYDELLVDMGLAWSFRMSNRYFMPVYKGTRPLTQSVHQGQALLPKDGVNVMCTWETYGISDLRYA